MGKGRWTPASFSEAKSRHCLFHAPRKGTTHQMPSTRAKEQIADYLKEAQGIVNTVEAEGRRLTIVSR